MFLTKQETLSSPEGGYNPYLSYGEKKFLNECNEFRTFREGTKTKHKKKEVSMKFSQYNYCVERNDGIVLLNIYNSKYIKITKEDDIEHLTKLCLEELPLTLEDKMVKSLYEQGYIVDSDTDEYAIAKADFERTIKEKEKHLRIILYVTEQCNFRCVYCPEKHINHSFSDLNWNALYKHLDKGIRSGKYNYVHISFFGGEPMLEINKIIPFLEKLKELSKEYPNVIFNHQMTTNGYLLTPEVYDKLVSFDVMNYQITVDGFAETHNKLRPLAGGQGNWDKIMENLKYINTRADYAKILLRANYNASNIKTLVSYKKWLQDNFNNSKFKFTFNPIVSLSENVPEELLADYESEESLNIYGKIENQMQFLKKFEGVCKSAYPYFYTISSKGEIIKCENITSNNYKSLIIGHLSENGEFVLNEGAEVWFNDFETEDCRECIAYPICCARSCPAKKALYPDARPDCKVFTDNFEKSLKRIFENNV